ncbi:MAG: hypothetical protein ABIJ50_04105 [Pseudomonadota bacterium]
MKFIGWWKRLLKVYHLGSEARTAWWCKYSLGFITYLLMVSYCYEKHRGVCIYRSCPSLRSQIRDEAIMAGLTMRRKSKNAGDREGN